MKLLPCPFCGSNDLFLGPTTVSCFVCCGSVQKNNWNTRHSPWISVQDKLYPINKEILITNGEGIYITSIDQSELDNEYFSMMVNDRFFEVKDFGITHWMPLPSPPENK